MSYDIDEDVVLTEKQVLDAAVHAAWGDEGYLTESGEKDKAKLAEVLYAKVAKAVVNATKERAGKAITRGTLVKTAFPSLPGPDAWTNEPDPELAGKVYGEVLSAVWDMLGLDKKSLVQRLLGERTSPRLVLCRCKVGPDSVDAVYVSRNKDCIKEDYLTFYSVKATAASARLEMATEMVIERVPEHGRAFARVFEQTVKGALETGNSKLKLALASNNGNGDDNDVATATAVNDDDDGDE